MNKFFLQFFTAVIVSVSSLSCSKTQVDENVYVDSYIHSILDASNEPVYAVMHTAYSFKPLSGVVVNGPLVNIQPTNPTGDGFSFYTVIPAASYTTTVPGPGDYSYTSTYQTGGSVTKSDATIAKSLTPPRQLEVIRGTNDITVKWQAVENAEAYKVRIFSDNPTTLATDLIFDSSFLIPNDATSDLSFPVSAGSFEGYMTNNMIFEVSAFIFQDSWNSYHAMSTSKVTKLFGI